MSDRLAELRRQRALVTEQLTWLDREIQRELGTPPFPRTAAPVVSVASTAQTPLTSTDLPAGASPAPALAIEPLLNYEVNPASVRQEVKKGCLLYFAAAFLFIGVLIVLAYFTLGKRS